MRPKQLSLIALLPFVFIGLPALAEEPAVDAVEQAVLDRLVGTWRTEYNLPKAEWTPEEKSATADLVYSRVLGGKFVQEQGVHSNNTTGMAMYTYDSTRKHYKMWWFSSEGHSSEAMGIWDAEKNTLTWRYSDDQFTTKSRL